MSPTSPSLRSILAFLPVISLILAACASRAPAGASAGSGTSGQSAATASATGESDSVGQYSYTSTAGGQPVTGTITITRTENGLRGMMSTGGMSRDITFEQVRVTGNRLVMEATAPAGPVKVELTRSGETIRGTWQMGARGNALQGRRIAR